MDKYIKFINENNLGKVYNDKKFKDITTLKVGGKIKLLFYPSSTSNFIKFYRWYLRYKDYKILIVGNGSNILASDDEYDGIVVSFKNIHEINVVNNIITASSGVMGYKVSNLCKELSLSGGEFLSAIPGTIGGICAMNASCYSQGIEDILIECLCFDGEKVKWIKKEDFKFNYRSSIAKIRNIIILKVKMIFKKSTKKLVEDRIKYIICNKRKNQPLNENSAGSVFINDGYNAWEVVKELNIKSKYKDVVISDKHYNFIINKNNASGNDIKELINEIKEKALEEKGIRLKTEWNFINFKEK